MPWHWRWMHLLPVEGVLGRLMTGLMVRYLNVQGAWLVAAVMAAAGLYFASAVSFWAVKEAAENRWLQLRSLHDRWRNWREQRAEEREEREALQDVARAEESVAAPALHLIAESGAEADLDETEERPGFFARLFSRWKRADEADPLDDIPAFAREQFLSQAQDEIPIAEPVRRTSIWERAESAGASAACASRTGAQTAPQNVVPIQPAPLRIAEARVAEAAPATLRADTQRRGPAAHWIPI